MPILAVCGSYVYFVASAAPLRVRPPQWHCYVLGGAFAEGQVPSLHTRQWPRPVCRVSNSFSPTGFWNRPLSRHAKVDPESKRLVGILVKEVKEDAANSRGPGSDQRQYSTSLYIVPGDQPTVRVLLTGSADEELQHAFDEVPLPVDAAPAAGQDAQLTVWQPTSDRLWEFWHFRITDLGWAADYGGAMDNVSTNPGRYSASVWPGAKPWWGATATSSPKIAGTMLLSELEAGRIPHALAVQPSDPRAGAFVWPAQGSDGRGDSTDIPEGVRSRLDPTPATRSTPPPVPHPAHGTRSPEVRHHRARPIRQ